MADAEHRRLAADRRGSVHVLEAMMACLLIAGAIVAVSTLHAPDGDVTSHLREGERKADDFLGLYTSLPASNTSVRYSHLLEEMLVEHMADPDTELARLLGAHGVANPRLYLEMEGRTRLVAGAPHNAGGGAVVGGSTFWPSTLGTTILAPTLSLHHATTPVQFQVLPVAMQRHLVPPGVPYEVYLEGSRDDGVTYTQSAPLHARIPQANQVPIRIDSLDGAGSVRHTFDENEVDTGSGYRWDLRFRLSALPPEDRNWLDDRSAFRFDRAPGWTVALEDPGNWTRTNAEHEPFWYLDYTGAPHRGAGYAWLNLTLERPDTDPITRHEHVALREQTPGRSEASIVLSPTSATRNTAPLILVSQPGPIPAASATELRFTITNPADTALSVGALEVRFPQHAHQFRYAPTGWIRSEAGTGATYTYDGPAVTVPAGSAQSVTIELHVEKAEGENMPASRAPVVEYLDVGQLEPPLGTGFLTPETGNEIAFAVGAPGGARGAYVATLDVESLVAGVHSVRVGGDTGARLPQGAGTFLLTEDPVGTLADLQAARQTMSMTIDPPFLAYVDGLSGTFDLGGLPGFFADTPGVGETVVVRVEAADFVQYLTGGTAYVSETARTVTEFLADPAFEVPATPEGFPGPLIVTVTVTVELPDHGAVDLRFVAQAFRTADAGDLNPTFMTGHLQYWSP